jgi:aminoglycoside phosphotransferase family enzyme/predicted kinase
MAHLVDDLLEELGRQAPVRLVETHLSWVLIGNDVFKIKKPVSFPFVDFSSFEERERACRNEVRINRRLAPRTYLGLVPIHRRSDGHFTFEGGGEVAEWAVHMKRLDESNRADARLDRLDVDALARAIARFHADAPTGPPIDRGGEVDLVEAHVRDNFVALGAIGSELESWQLAFLRENRARFDARIASGRIRDGHGDLRLEHVFVREDGDFEIIDGIEFDDRYRWGDVAADVAFLAMDLARVGRVDLAERFVASYARAAEDFDLYGVIDFYESYRACIRAKISPAEARRYLVLAETARRRSVLDPVLVCVGGGIACGKSTLAERLGAALSAPVIDADRTRKHLLGLAATEHAASTNAWKGAYDPAFSAKVYAEVLRRAGVVLASGRPVVLDASFRSAAARTSARELASQHGVPFRFLECRAPIDVARARLEARDRSSSVSDATPAILDAFAAGYEPVTELGPAEHRVVDTSGPVETALASVLEVVSTWPRGLVA